MRNPIANSEFTYVYFAGHGEYMIDCAEVFGADFEAGEEGLQDIPAWLSGNPDLITLGWEHDPAAPSGVYIALACDEAELARLAAGLFETLKTGPEGGDDDTFDYWPSGVRLLRQMVEDLPASATREGWIVTLQRSLTGWRAEHADEIMARSM